MHSHSTQSITKGLDMTWARKPGPLSGEEITTSFNNTGMAHFNIPLQGPQDVLLM